MSKEIYADIEAIETTRNILLKKYQDDKKAWLETPAYKLCLEELGCHIDRPSGFKVLIKIFGFEDKAAHKQSSIILPDSVKDKSLWSCRIGKVLAMGPEAYDPRRFPLGPYCEVGDYIFFARPDAFICRFNNNNITYLNDERCIATVQDPSKFDTEFQIGV